MPEDISTTDQVAADSVEDTQVMPVSGVAAAVATLASAAIGEDPAKLMVHPEAIPLADRVQPDSEDCRIDIRSSARVAAVDTTVVLEDTKVVLEDTKVVPEGTKVVPEDTNKVVPEDTDTVDVMVEG